MKMIKLHNNDVHSIQKLMKQKLIQSIYNLKYKINNVNLKKIFLNSNQIQKKQMERSKK